MQNCEDFLKARGEPETIAGFKTVLLHPLADSPGPFPEGITSEDCEGADLYCVIKDRVYHMSIWSCGLSLQPAGFASFHRDVRDNDNFPIGKFYVVIHSKLVTTRIVESMVLAAAHWLEEHPDTARGADPAVGIDLEMEFS